jgi:chemotaxis protein MotB
MTNPRIIIKRISQHGGHNGGAWKVAYADFVTALMALFIVLWLMNSSKEIREAVGGYFKDPSGTSKKIGSGLTGSGESFNLTKDNMTKLKEELQKEIRNVTDFSSLESHIEMTVTSEGLRIELTESEFGTFFHSAKADPTGSGEELLSRLAKELGKLPNKVSIEGHTDARPYAGRSGYTNWELSTDRANSARRFMQSHGLGSSQVAQVRGYADQRLRNPSAPNDASNRRISVIVQYQPKSLNEAPGETAGNARN